MKIFSSAFLDLFVSLVTALFIIMAVTAFWGAQHFNNPGPLTEPTTIEIPQGSSLATIANLLNDRAAITNKDLFIIGTRILRAGGNLKAGEYEIAAAMSSRDIMELLKSGQTVLHRFTIPEGRTSYEIVQIINAVPDLEGTIDTIPAEGSLLPETYDYQRGEERSKIIERMQQSMQKTLDDLWAQRAENLPFTAQDEALTLASIVEKETGVAEERKRIAGVFINRLRAGIPLQTDPTVIYAITKGAHKSDGLGPLGRRLLKKDLETPSPYNTYLNAGLPPGPIANPGRAAIEAVLNPEEHDFLYFVADGTGGHVFSKTLKEHNDNVAKWRKIRKTQGD